MTGSKQPTSVPSVEVSEAEILSSSSLPDWRSKADKLQLNSEYHPDRNRPGFRQFCKTTGVDLRTFKGSAKLLLSATNDADKQEELARSLIRGLFNIAAGTITDPDLSRRFSSSDLPDKQLIEALAFVSSEERLKCVRALLYLSSHYPRIESFLEQKLNNILHFTSTGERGSLINESLKAGPQETSSDRIRRILAASVDLEQMCELTAICGKENLLALKNKSVTELVARSTMIKELRKLLQEAEQTDDSLPPQERINRLEGLLDAAGTYCVSDTLPPASVAVKRMLKDISLRLGELRTLRHSSLEEDKLHERLDNLAARIGVEFWYGIRLADERSNTAETHRRWSTPEIIEAAEALGRIPEGRLLFTPKLHTIQRVKTLGDYILGMREDNGVVKITDAAMGHVYVERAYRGMSSFQITLTHELGHAIQLGPEGPGLMEGDRELMIIPGDPSYNFAEFMQLSDWQIIHPSRYSIRDSGLSVRLDGHDLPVGVPCSFENRRIILVLNQGILLSYDTNASFSLIDYSRTNPWEDWAEGFCEYIMLPERLRKFAPEKYMYFEEEFRKYAAAGTAKELARLKGKERRNEEECLSKAA